MGILGRELAQLICRRLRNPSGPLESEWRRIRRDTRQHFAGQPEAAFFQAYIREAASVEEASQDAWIEPRTGYRYRESILTYAALLAVDAGILDLQRGREIC